MVFRMISIKRTVCFELPAIVPSILDIYQKSLNLKILKHEIKPLS